MTSIANNAFFGKTLEKTMGVVGPVYKVLDFLAPLSVLALRLWVAWVFFKSGLLKYGSWDSTMYLFENEYEVPFFSPEVAAYLGTAAELTLPVLLAFGLAGRFGALGLFLFNIIAVISYPDLNPAGVQDHQVWGLMLLVPMLHGPGKLSVDYLITRKWMKK